jgi:hypothetical protein
VVHVSKLIPGAEVYSVVNAALEVLKKLGHGFHEKPYENGLVVELSSRGMPCQQQRCFNVVYKGTKVGEYIPDLIAVHSRFNFVSAHSGSGGSNRDSHRL